MSGVSDFDSDDDIDFEDDIQDIELDEETDEELDEELDGDYDLPELDEDNHDQLNNDFESEEMNEVSSNSDTEISSYADAQNTENTNNQEYAIRVYDLRNRNELQTVQQQQEDVQIITVNSNNSAIIDINMVEDNLSLNSNQSKEKKNDDKINTSLNDSKLSCNEAGTCTICYEHFTTSTEHRMVCLKCGHIYGKVCIERWIATNGSKTRCPECNALVKKNDIRVIYSHTVRALDTSERDEALNQAEKYREQNYRLLEQVDELKMTIGLKESEIYNLKKQLNDKDLIIESMKGNRIANNLLNVKNKSLAQRKEPFKLLEQIPIHSGGARLLATSEYMATIWISHQSPNQLYKGYGLRKLQLHNTKRVDFMFLHEKMIRDVAIHPSDALILTAASDRSVKITNLITSPEVLNLSLNNEPYSVCWDSSRHDRFYVGLNNGKVVACCSRTGVQLKEFLTPSKLPIVSLHAISSSICDKAALLITSMNSSFYGQISNELQSPQECNAAILNVNSLNIEDRFISTHLLQNQNIGHILLSCRTSSKNQFVHHWLLDYQIEESNSPVLIRSDIRKQLVGGRTSMRMSKSKIFTHPNDVNSALICCSDEDEKGVLIWEINEDEPIQRLKCNAPVLDLAFMKISNPSGFLLVVLTEYELFLYNWTL